MATLLSAARSAWIACLLSALSRLSSSLSSRPKPGPRRTKVAPRRPPSSNTSNRRRAWRRTKRTSIPRLPGAGRLEFEAALSHDTHFFLLLNDVHAPIGFAQQLIRIGAVFGERRMSDAE